MQSSEGYLAASPHRVMFFSGAVRLVLAWCLADVVARRTDH